MKDRAAYANNKSGIKGVYWYQKLNMWVARATLNNKKHHLGYFADKFEAKRAFDKFFESSRDHRNPTQEKHGKYNTRAYSAWRSMINRCTLPSQENYHGYGGRGISFDERWAEFEEFFNDMGDCPDKMSLDRINNDLGYSKDNCRWADAKTQANNKRNNLIISAFGFMRTLSQWSELTGLKATTISARIYDYGWTAESALSIKRRGNKKANRPATYTNIEEKLGIVHSKAA